MAEMRLAIVHIICDRRCQQIIIIIISSTGNTDIIVIRVYVHDSQIRCRYVSGGVAITGNNFACMQPVNEEALISF